jgi:hypothetical protein
MASKAVAVAGFDEQSLFQKGTQMSLPGGTRVVIGTPWWRYICGGESFDLSSIKSKTYLDLSSQMGKESVKIRYQNYLPSKVSTFLQ